MAPNRRHLAVGRQPSARVFVHHHVKDRPSEWTLPDWMLSAIETERKNGYYSGAALESAMQLAIELEQLMLRGRVKVLTEMLSFSKPDEFSRLMAETVFVATAALDHKLHGTRQMFETQVVKALPRPDETPRVPHG